MVVGVLHQVHLRLWVHGSMGIVRPKSPEKNKDHECKHNTERNSSSSTDAIRASIPKWYHTTEGPRQPNCCLPTLDHAIQQRYIPVTITSVQCTYRPRAPCNPYPNCSSQELPKHPCFTLPHKQMGRSDLWITWNIPEWISTTMNTNS